MQIPRGCVTGRAITFYNLGLGTIDGTFQEIRLVNGHSPWAGLPEIRRRPQCSAMSWSVALCSSLPSPRPRQDVVVSKYMTCKGTEPTIRNCSLNNKLRSGCNLLLDAEVVLR